ncbi:MAG: hypothetical protein Q8O13_10105 [Candidatus Omnitrophota bacterium]|nr:hypothetical protein [Candidatus Omnitrophota bacterium]
MTKQTLLKLGLFLGILFAMMVLLMYDSDRVNAKINIKKLQEQVERMDNQRQEGNKAVLEAFGVNKINIQKLQEQVEKMDNQRQEDNAKHGKIKPKKTK